QQDSRRAMLKGVVIGACAGALAATVALGLPVLHAHSPRVDHVGRVPPEVVVPFKALPQPAILTPVLTFKHRQAVKQSASAFGPGAGGPLPFDILHCLVWVTSLGGDVMTVPQIDYAAVFQNIPVPALLLTPGFVIADVNLAYLRTTGRTRDELL